MTNNREDLLNALTAAEPLGPIAHERMASETLGDLVYQRIALFTDVATKPHMLFLGRKGAGKSALLGQIRRGTYKHGRRGLVVNNDEPTRGRDYVIEVYSWEHFNQIVRNVSSLVRREELLQDLIPTEYFVEMWYQTLWDEIIQFFYRFHAFDDDCRRLLAPVDRYVHADSPFDGSVQQQARDLLNAAKTAVLEFLSKRSSRLFFLFDSMENYPIRNATFLRIVSGLFQGLTRITDESPRLIVSFCIPEEIESFITLGSGNVMKDFASSFRIRWRPIDLVRIVAHRLRLSASLHDQKLYSEIVDLDFSKRDDLHRLFSLVLPPTITNGRGTEEDSLAYIIRHTQLLPRHILAIFNAALSSHFKATTTLRELSGEAIRTGIVSVEKLIAKQILLPYEQIFPKLLASSRVILPDLDPICRRSELRKIEGRFTRQIEDDVVSVWHTLFDIGVIGRSAESLNGMSHGATSDDRYCYGQFHFNMDGAFSLPTDAEFCFHPVFSRAFGMVRRSNDNRVVYPAHIDLTNIYADA